MKLKFANTEFLVIHNSHNRGKNKEEMEINCLHSHCILYKYTYELTGDDSSRIFGDFGGVGELLPQTTSSGSIKPMTPTSYISFHVTDLLKFFSDKLLFKVQSALSLKLVQKKIR